MLRRTIDTGPFEFEAGGRTGNLHLVYHVSDCSEGKVILVCHALTANSDPEDWWPGLVGPGKTIDISKYRVFCVNVPCSPYGSDGPSTLNAESGKAWMFDWPAVTIRDMARAISLVRKHLGYDKVDLVIGSSFGGFQALECLLLEPEVYKEALLIATAAKVSPWLAATNETQRMALEADPGFLAAQSPDGGAKGLECARAQALLCYRSFEGYALTQQESDEDFLFASRPSSYQRHQGEKFLKRHFDAYSYWYLSKALDSHNCGRGRGGCPAALSGIRARTTLVGVTSDGIFPPSELKYMASYIHDPDYREISSDFGHDGFLLENDKLIEIIRPILSRL